MWTSMVAQMVKNLPAMLETWIRSLGWEDPLEEGMATHYNILAWKIPMDREAWRATVHGVAKSWTHQEAKCKAHMEVHILILFFELICLIFLMSPFFLCLMEGKGSNNGEQSNSISDLNLTA